MGASSDRRGAQQGSGSGLTRRESVACASPTEPFLARLADSPRQSEGAESMRPPRSGAAHSLYAGVRGNLLRPLPAPCVGMRSREQNAPRVLWNTGQIDRARFRFATAGLSVEASLRVEVPPQGFATESTGTPSHWGQGRSIFSLSTVITDGRPARGIPIWCSCVRPSLSTGAVDSLTPVLRYFDWRILSAGSAPRDDSGGQLHGRRAAGPTP